MGHLYHGHVKQPEGSQNGEAANIGQIEGLPEDETPKFHRSSQPSHGKVKRHTQNLGSMIGDSNIPNYSDHAFEIHWLTLDLPIYLQ